MKIATTLALAALMAMSGFAQDSQPRQPQQPSSTTGQTPAPKSTPLVIPGSMVGYVDDAVVSTQVRFRFDSAYGDHAPDRAEFFYPQCSCTNLPGAPGPNFPGASSDINFQQEYVQAEYAVQRRLSLFAEVPFRSIEPQPGSFVAGSFSPAEVPSTNTQSRIGDIKSGIKFAVQTTPDRVVTVQFRAYFPTGDGSRGLGTDHYSIEPSLLYYQRLSNRWAVESQVGDWHPVGGSQGEQIGSQTLSNFAGDVFFYGVGPSYLLVDGPRVKFAPVVELFGWRVLGGLQTPPTPFPANSICTTGVGGCSVSAAGTDIVNLKLGGRVLLGERDSFYAGYGRALTSATWYDDIIRIEFRRTFKAAPFLDGMVRRFARN